MEIKPGTPLWRPGGPVHHSSGGGFLPASFPSASSSNASDPNAPEIEALRRNIQRNECEIQRSIPLSTDMRQFYDNVSGSSQKAALQQTIAAQTARAQCAAAWYAAMLAQDEGGNEPEEVAPEPAPENKEEVVGFDPEMLALAVQHAKEKEEAEAAEEQQKKEQDEAARLQGIEEAVQNVRREHERVLHGQTKEGMPAPKVGPAPELPSSENIIDRTTELANAFALDELSTKRLVGAFIERALLGCHLDTDIGMMSEHLATASKASGVVMSMMKDLKSGKAISSCKHYQQRLHLSQERPGDEIAKMFHDGGSPLQFRKLKDEVDAEENAKKEKEQDEADLAKIPAAFRAAARKKLMAEKAAKAALGGSAPIVAFAKAKPASQPTGAQPKASARSTAPVADLPWTVPDNFLPESSEPAVQAEIEQEAAQQDVLDDAEKPRSAAEKALDAIRINANVAQASTWVPVAKPKPSPKPRGPVDEGAKIEDAPSTNRTSGSDELNKIYDSFGGAVDPPPEGASESDPVAKAKEESDALLDRAKAEFQGSLSGQLQGSGRRYLPSPRRPSPRRDNDPRNGPVRDRSPMRARRSRSRQGGAPRRRSRSRRGPRGRSRSRRRSLSGRRRSRSRAKGAEVAPPDEEPRKKKRGSKWDEPAAGGAGGGNFGGPPATGGGFGGAPGPAPQAAPMMAGPPGPSKNYKVLKMTGVQVRALLGPKGESINLLRRQSGCDIQVHHKYPAHEGHVSIVGSTAVGERMISELLAERGCPLIAGDTITPAEMEEIPIARHLVGLFIGKGGEKIKEMQELVGGGVHIGIQPYTDDNGLQLIRIVGPNRFKARAMIQMKVDAIKLGHSEEKPGAKEVTV